jgi:hypothetical protein
VPSSHPTCDEDDEGWIQMDEMRMPWLHTAPYSSIEFQGANVAFAAAQAIAFPA